MEMNRPLFKRKIQLRWWLWSGTHKGKGKEEGQREQYERKPWLLGKHGEKLYNSARTV
jgi:hypothetical protein